MGKYVFDLALAAIIAVPAFILCSLCVLLIKFESQGPGVFRQTRVGVGRVPFTLFKLRTMAFDTGDHASHQVSRAKITKVGAFLRRTKLDELPQVINVLMGQMSFVGPRPCLPTQDELISERERLNVYSIKPGITGPAQLAGIDMSTPTELARADATYLRCVGFGYDLKILVQTAFGHGRGDAVKKDKLSGIDSSERHSK